tara:strand:- start:1639 stop:2085 length:447 start_codon:yes stop_codon:yes gene_type:complete
MRRTASEVLRDLEIKVAHLEKKKGLEDLYNILTENNFRIRGIGSSTIEAKISKVEKFERVLSLEIKLSSKGIFDRDPYLDRDEAHRDNISIIENTLDRLFPQLSPFFDSFRYEISWYGDDNSIYLDSVEYDLEFYGIEGSSFKVKIYI